MTTFRSVRPFKRWPLRGTPSSEMPSLSFGASLSFGDGTASNRNRTSAPFVFDARWIVVVVPTLLPGLLAATWPISAKAQTSALEQRTACMGDALRLCASDIPDRQKIIECLGARHGQLTPGCVIVFDANMRALREHGQ